MGGFAIFAHALPPVSSKLYAFMNNQEWSACSSSLKMLQALSEQATNEFHTELQMYFIDCCNKYIHLLPHKEFRVALDLAKQYSEGTVNLEQVRKQNWYTEGAVFSMEYETDKENNSDIYKNVQTILNLHSVADAKKFAVALGYFIDWTSIYLSDFSERVPIGHEQFLDPDFLRRRINAPF